VCRITSHDLRSSSATKLHMLETKHHSEEVQQQEVDVVTLLTYHGRQAMV